MTDAELDAIERRADAAPPGPWFVADDGWPYYESKAGGGWLPVWAADVPRDDSEANPYRPHTYCQEAHDFIAAARSDVPALVAEVRRLRKMLCWMGLEMFACGCENFDHCMTEDEVAKFEALRNLCGEHREAR